MRRQELANDIHLALRKRRIHPYYQPQISTDGYRIIGVEALLRWNHPEQGWCCRRCSFPSRGNGPDR
jgi:EAL domain-containing protein (putative c-di-GMP-specific phosphodiesterase class I)